MTDFDDFERDYLAGMSNRTKPDIDFSDIDRMIEKARELAAERVPVRVSLTNADMDALVHWWSGERLQVHGLAAPPPLASLRGLPIFRGERSEIVYSDGTVEPLRASDPGGPPDADRSPSR